MLTTEEEAKARWCPFARVIYQFRDRTVAGAAGNRIKDDGGPARLKGSSCMASSCMAWRWDGWPTNMATVAPMPYPEDRTGSRVGHCGLAGQPSLYGQG